MQIDAVFNIDGMVVVQENVDYVAKDGTKFVAEELYGILFPAKVFQIVVFANKRFQRRTLVVHAYNPVTYEFTCGILKIDMGNYNDPSVREEWLAFVESQKDEE